MEGTVAKKAETYYLNWSLNGPWKQHYYGKVFYCKGKISCSHKLKEVRGVIEENGHAVYSKPVYPNSKSYCINNSAIDKALRFDKLQGGKYYTYKIQTRDEKMSKLETLIECFFQVISDLKIQDHTKIGTLKKGKAWVCRGTVKSSHNLTNVTGSIINPDSNTPLYCKSVKLNKKTYQLSGSEIDNALRFDKLAARSKYYIYEITAKDASGYGKTLVREQFYVK